MLSKVASRGIIYAPGSTQASSNSLSNILWGKFKCIRCGVVISFIILTKNESDGFIQVFD